MKKPLPFVLICTTLLLAACNLPMPSATPTVDLVATQVAIQLTSLPTQGVPEDIPTATLPAEDTTSPAELTVTPSPPSPTATQTLTPTIPAGDPRQSLGDPTWEETFESGRSFGLEEPYDDEQTSFRIKNGALILTSKNASGFHGWRTGGPITADNAYVEGRFEIGSCFSEDRYGLVFRSPDFIEGYIFLVSCDGRYELDTWENESFTTLLSGQAPSQGLLTGSNQVNRLGVRMQGDRISLYANGQLLQETTDTTFQEGGHVGAAIAGYQSQPFTVRLSEIAFWNLNQSEE